MESLLCSMFSFVLFVLLWTQPQCNAAAAATPILSQLSSSSKPLSVLLVSSPYTGHVTPMLALSEELVRRGHNVTLVSGPDKLILQEVERLSIHFWSTGEEYITNKELLDKFARGGFKGVIMTIIEMTVDFQEKVLQAIDSPDIEQYDIMVVDAVFSTFSLCFSRKWDIPVVNLWPSLMSSPFKSHLWTHPLSSTDFSDDLTFYQRLLSTVVPVIVKFVTMQVMPGYLGFLEPVCKNSSTSILQSLYREDYLPQIIATSFGFEFPRVELPLTEYVGPILPQSPPPLSSDMAQWLDQRDRGSVVYVSMGSTVVLTASEAESIVTGAIRAGHSVVWSLRRSNQDILEKINYDSERVLVSEWVPQLSLLRHPSIHSAILHGGLGGVQEALGSGVPIIVVPFFGDQLDNAVRVHHNHYGRMIHRHQLTSDLVSQSLRMFDTDLYRQSLLKTQRIYRQDGGSSRVADLLEFYSEVGYQHLVPAYVKYNWSWIEFHNIDVMVVLALSVLLPTFLLYRILHYCFCRAFSKPKNKTE